MRGVEAVLACALCACAGKIDVPIPAGATSYLLFTLDEADKPITLHAYDAPDLQQRVLFGQSAEEPYRLLEYDQDLEQLMVIVDEDHEVEILPGAASLDEAWPLPQPKAWSEAITIDRGFQPRELPDLTAWLADFTVRRPPCPEGPTLTRIAGLPLAGGLDMAFRFGDDTILGFNGDPNARSGPVPPSVLVLRAGTSTASPITGFEPAGMLQTGPTGFVDGEVARILWQVPTTQALDLISIDRALHVVEDIAPDVPMRERIKFEAMAGGTFGGKRIIAARANEVIDPLAARPSHLLRLGAETESWVITTTVSQLASAQCGSDVSTLMLEVDASGRGWAGLLAGPIVRLDLSLPGLIKPEEVLVPDGDRYCRNSRATLKDGVELLTFESATTVGPAHFGMLWRRPSEPRWEPLKDAGFPQGQTITALGNLAIADGIGDLVLVLEHVPSRPEIPPRMCHVVPMGINVFHSVVLDDHRVLVGGEGRDLAVILDFSRDGLR